MVERLCAQGQPTAQMLQELQTLFAEEAAYDGWTLALEGERAGMHELFTVIENGKVDMRMVRSMMGMSRRSWRDWLDDYLPGPTTQQSHAWLLKHFNEQLAASKLPPAQRSARLRELDQLGEQAPALAKMVLLTPWKRLIYPKQLLDVKLSATVAGLAAERYRLERGAWPQSLAALTPQYLPRAPADPYTGAPLQWKATVDGVVIFCAGPDGSWQGDAWDLPLTTANWGDRHAHEFRLWSPGKRRQK